MKIPDFVKYAAIAIAAAIPCGCSTGTVPGAANQAAEVQVRAAFAKTNAAGFAPAFHHLRIHAHLSLLPLRKGSKQALLYASDIDEGAVEVFDYSGGTYLGEATGFEYPSGECSDKNGNVYVADFDAGTISEIAEGTTEVIKVVDAVYPLGCAISEKTGDLAVTLYENGSVEIFAGGISGSPKIYAFTDFTWPAGYDSKGNLYAEGEGGQCSDYCVWTLQAGSSTPAEVTWTNGSLEFPGGIELDGKQLMFGTQEYDGSYESAIYPTTCSSTTCTSTTPIVFSDTCYHNYVDVVQWAEDSKKPNLQSKGKAGGDYAFAGGNLWCEDSGGYVGISEWSTAGGNPTGTFGPPPYGAYGQTIVN
jgi:hypothetical protein